jgi:hypothetical protein
MTQIQDSAFPNHRFDFADHVFVLPLQKEGTVEGILYRDKLWYYLITIASASDSWWREDELAFDASEHLAACERSPSFITAEPFPENLT